MFTEQTGNMTTLRWVALDGRLLSVWRIPEPPAPAQYESPVRLAHTPRRQPAAAAPSYEQAAFALAA